SPPAPAGTHSSRERRSTRRETRRAILPNPSYSIALNAIAMRPLKHEIDRSRFGDRERNRLECSRFHGVSDIPDRLVAQRDPGGGHGLVLGTQGVRRSAS